MRKTIPILLFWLILSPVYAQQTSITTAYDSVKSESPPYFPTKVDRWEREGAEELKVVDSPPPAEEMPAGTFSTNLPSLPRPDLVYRLGQPAMAGIHRGGEIRSDTLPEQNGLVDHSAATGQEGASSSAPTVGYFTIKGEISHALNSAGKWSYQLSEREIDPYFDLSEIQSDSIALYDGDFYAGTSGKQVFQLRLPVQESFSRFTLTEGGIALVEDLWVQPGDSLLLHWDQKSRQLFFSGPAAVHARIQMQLQTIARSQASERNPVMILSNVDAMLNTAAKEKRYQEVVSGFNPGWSRYMEWLDTEEGKLDRARELFSYTSDSNPLIQELEREKDRLSPDLYTWLKGYWKGTLRKSPLQFIQIVKPNSAEWASLIMEYSREQDVEAPSTNWTFAPAALVESLYLENKLLSEVLPVSFLHLTADLPKLLQDQVNALFLIRNYKNLADVDSLFTEVMASVQAPVIAQKLDELYRSNLQGSDFPEFAFQDVNGSPVYPEEWEGKLVFMDFWLSGCGACFSFAKDSFFPLMEVYKHNPDVLFVTVSGDSDQELWENSLKSGRYTTNQSLNLFSGGTDHPTLRQNMVRSFPAQLLVDREGRILQTGNFPTDTAGWIELIASYLPESVPLHSFSISKPKTP